jgi:protein TonB
LVSAANSNSGSAPSAPGARAPFSGTPIAHQAAVIATGARTDESGKRELFKENTTTALVFPNGGVIRLAAAAASGQLLFLTNPQSHREVVAQVTRRRNNPGSGYYIELEFTEPAPDFWGVIFPETPSEPEAVSSPAPTASFEQAIAPAAAEFLQPAEPGSDDLSPNAPAPSSDEVNALMEEVEALRAQLKSMQSQAASPSLPGMQLPTPPVADPSAAPPASNNPAPDLGAMLSSLVASQASQPGSPAKDSKPAEAPATSSPNPTQATRPKPPAHEPDELDDALLPKPALDFTKSAAPPPSSAARAPLRPAFDRTGILRLALLAVVSLFAVMVAAWNMHLLPWLAPKPNAPIASAPTQPSAKKSSPAAPAPPQKTDPPSSMRATTAANPPSAPVDIAPSPASSMDAVAAPTSSRPPTAAKSASSSDTESSLHHDAATPPLTSVSKHSSVRDSKPTDTDSAPSSVDDDSITPPRLIKSIRAVAPGDALRQFMTGNVTVDALIDKTGEVKSMKVLSGPPSFHKAAMEALKHYRYEPARQNGKPISAHLTVTIPFWFEP